MGGVRKLQTQSEAFWRDEYEVSDSDLDLITGLILDAGKPQTLDTLASTIIVRRFQREKEAIARQATSGTLYQPMGQFEVGQELAFSALDFAMGHVVTVRPGHNPKYEPFDVVRVRFEDGSEREFVARFDKPHPLNRPAEELLGRAESDLNESEMVRLFEHYVARKLKPALESNKSFTSFNGMWFLIELLPEIHLGHLNLAEAMIYEAGHPLVAPEILKDLELGGTASVGAQLFALNHALGQDARFDNIGSAEEPIWYLRALEPEAAFNRPAVLEPAFRAAGGEYLGITMLDMVEEVGDELDDVETMPLRPADSVHFEVTFPHLYAGTMPATLQFLRFIPSDQGRRFTVTLTDARDGHKFEAWVVPQERYVCGLGDWYTSVGMCVGAQVSVTPAGEPRTFLLNITPTRSKRSEWICTASAADDNLVLQMQRVTIAVRSDRNMLVDVPDRAAIARLIERTKQAHFSLHTLVRTAFEELAKLSGRGVVHAKSIYSVANMLCRTGSVPVFAELTRRACYDPVGAGSWAYDPSLEGVIYATPDEMRERPRSRREDLVKDQVVQYLGK